MMTPRYPIVVFWSEQDEIWVADAPDLKSCSAFGETPEKAVAELETAMAAWIGSATRAGHHLPRPSAAGSVLAAE